MASPQGKDFDGDLTPYITSTALLIDNAQDAIHVLWLVECGLLKAMPKTINKYKGVCLGHGCVLAWVDHKPNTKDIVTFNFK
jgi:hypothetical protein